MLQLLNSLECPEAHLLFWLPIALHSFFSMEAFPGLQVGRGYCRSLLPCMLRTRSGGCTYAFFRRQALNVSFRLKGGLLFTDTATVVRLSCYISVFYVLQVSTVLVRPTCKTPFLELIFTQKPFLPFSWQKELWRGPRLRHRHVTAFRTQACISALGTSM